MIFKAKLDKLGQKRLLAYCNDKRNPCGFDINIDMGLIIDIEYHLESVKEKINKYKLLIIKSKNDYLYGYISKNDVVNIFEKYNKLIEKDMYDYKLYSDYYDRVIVWSDNVEKIKELNELLTTYILETRELVKNKEYVKAGELYVNSIIPLNTELLSRKYNINKNNILKIRRPEYTKIIEYYEQVVDPRVVKFVV
jgi:hypothetical protein